jgi:hypothetical protein
MHYTNTTFVQVPQPHYNATNYANTATGGGDIDISVNPRLYRLALNTASAARPVPLASTFPNETYHIRFDGPAVRCQPANNSVIANLTAEFGSNSANVVNGNQGNRFKYLSWVPGDEAVLDYYNAFDHDPFLTLDQRSLDVARIFVMTNIGYWNVSIVTESPYGTIPYINGSDLPALETRQINVTECHLYNATYDVDFGFQYPDQTYNISVSEWLNPVIATNPNYGSTVWYSNASEILSYTAMMDSFGRLLVGRAGENHYGSEKTSYTSYAIMGIDWSDGLAIQHGLEQLFQNYTISLLSDPGLIKNSSLADLIPVEVTTYPIPYVYDDETLLIAYGVALVSNVLCCAVGLYAFFVNHASYQNLFSTFLRATNNAAIRALIVSDDNGADPIPKDLGKVKISMLENPA